MLVESEPSMKITLAVVGLIVAAVLAWFVSSARREARYRATLTQYEHELPRGTTRAEVQKYLDQRGVQYRPDIDWRRSAGLDAIDVDLGPTSGALGCTWKAYLELQFELVSPSPHKKPSPSDRLTDIRLSKSSFDCW